MTRGGEPARVGTWRKWLHWLLAAAGLAGVGWLVSYVGARNLLAAAGALALWFPVVLALEGARIGCDAHGARLLYGSHASGLPTTTLWRAHLLAYPATLLLPAGRAAGEGIKAALLHRYVGVARVAAAAVVAPALALFGVFAVSLPIAVLAAAEWGASWFSYAIAIQAATAIGAGYAFLIIARRPELGRGLERLSARLGATTEKVQLELRDIGMLPRGPLALAVLNHAILALQIVVLAHAIGMTGATPLLAVGVHLVGLAVGDAVPGQLGATDASFALASSALDVALASSVAIAVTMHAVQLSWAGAGALAAVVWRERG